MAKGEVLYGLDDKRQRKDGTIIDTTTSAAAFFDAEGAVLGVITASEDITDRKRADQLSRIEHGVVRCLAETDDTGAALKSVMRNWPVAWRTTSTIFWVRSRGNVSIPA